MDINITQEKEVLGFNNNFPNNILRNSNYIAYNKFRSEEIINKGLSKINLLNILLDGSLNYLKGKRIVLQILFIRKLIELKINFIVHKQICTNSEIGSILSDKQYFNNDIKNIQKNYDIKKIKLVKIESTNKTNYKKDPIYKKLSKEASNIKSKFKIIQTKLCKLNNKLNKMIIDARKQNKTKCNLGNLGNLKININNNINTTNPTNPRNLKINTNTTVFQFNESQCECKRNNNILIQPCNHCNQFKIPCIRCDSPSHVGINCHHFRESRINTRVNNINIEYRKRFKFNVSIANNIKNNYVPVEAGGTGHCGYLSIMAYCEENNIKLFPSDFNFTSDRKETFYPARKLRHFIKVNLDYGFDIFKSVIELNPNHFKEFTNISNSNSDEVKETHIRHFYERLKKHNNRSNSTTWIDEEMLSYISAITDKVILVINSIRNTSNRLFIPPSINNYNWELNNNSKRNYLFSKDVIKLYNYDNIHYRWYNKK
jgi:hypothetical protein